MTTYRFAFLALLFALSCAAQQFGSVRGVVTTNAGQPVRKAQVLVRSATARNNPGMVYETEASGTFGFPGLPPGRYSLSVRRTGYLSPGGKEVVVGPGQQVEVAYKLIPHSVISGRVTDEDGEAIQGARVIALRERFVRGLRQIHGVEDTTANDLGEYRLAGLPPGTYILLATAKEPHGRRPMRVTKPGQTTVTGFVPTYHPGVLDLSAAAPLVVAEGQELGSIDLQIRKTSLVNVRGRVLAVSGAPLPNVNLSVRNADNATAPILFDNSMANVTPHGTFVVNGLPPGNYLFTVRAPNKYAGFSTVQVGSQDLDDVFIRMSPPASVSGVVKAEGSPDLQRTRIRLSGIGVYPLQDSVSQPMAGKAEFAVTGVPQSSYRLRVLGAPDGYYLKSVTLNGEDVTDKGLAISSSIFGLEVTLAPGAQSITGVLIGSNGEPAVGTVALAPAGSKFDHWDLYQTGAADEKGQFSFRHLPPGEYLLLGYGLNANVERIQDPDYMRQVAPVATSVSLKETAAPKPVEVKVVE